MFSAFIWVFASAPCANLTPNNCLNQPIWCQTQGRQGEKDPSRWGSKTFAVASRTRAHLGYFGKLDLHETIVTRGNNPAGWSYDVPDVGSYTLGH
jgi:hypothetical protein